MQKYSKIFAWAVVAVMVVAAAVTLLCGGFNFSQTLSGGYVLKFDINQEFELEDLSRIIAAQGVGDYQVLKAGEKQDQALIRVQKIADEGDAMTQAIQAEYAGAKFRGCDVIARAMPRMTLLFLALAVLAAILVASLYFMAQYGSAGGIGAFIASIGTMALLLSVILIVRFSITPALLAALLAAMLYSLLDVGVYFEQMRDALRKGNSDALEEEAEGAAKACRLRRVLVALVGAAMFLAAYLLGEASLMGWGLCAMLGVLFAALCTSLLGLPASLWAKKTVGKGKKVRKKVKAIR